MKNKDGFSSWKKLGGKLWCTWSEVTPAKSKDVSEEKPSIQLWALRFAGMHAPSTYTVSKVHKHAAGCAPVLRAHRLI